MVLPGKLSILRRNWLEFGCFFMLFTKFEWFGNILLVSEVYTKKIPTDWRGRTCTGWAKEWSHNKANLRHEKNETVSFRSVFYKLNNLFCQRARDHSAFWNVTKVFQNSVKLFFNLEFWNRQMIFLLLPIAFFHRSTTVYFLHCGC